MAVLNIPTSEQFEETIKNLTDIAVALSTKIDTSSWLGVRQAVRTGVAAHLFPIGTQFEVAHDVYGKRLYDVVAHDCLKSSQDRTAHTMTLLSHDLITFVQYDSPEAFYYAESTLPPGTYNVVVPDAYCSWSAGSYSFTLSVSLPKGGQLCFSQSADTAIPALQVVSYSSRTSTTPLESVACVSGENGTNLGTFGEKLNHAHRVAHGSNNYKESAIRQFLNSPGLAGSVWTPQTKFDRPPSWHTSLDGFLGGLDDEFLSVIGEVTLPCCANNHYEASDSTVTKGTSYTLNDRFYLPSQREIFGKVSNAVEDNSVPFPFYDGSVSVDRIKYQSASVANWWTRTPQSPEASSVYVCKTTGEVGSVSSRSGSAVAVACTIM